MQNVLLWLRCGRPVDAERTDGPPVLIGHRDRQREQHSHGGGDPAEALAADGQLGQTAVDVDALHGQARLLILQAYAHQARDFMRLDARWQHQDGVVDREGGDFMAR